MSDRSSRRKNTIDDQALPNDGVRIASARQINPRRRHRELRIGMLSRPCLSLQLVASDLREPIGMQLDEEHVALFVLTKKR